VLEHPSVIAMRKLAAQLQVAIPTSFFERDGHHYYNTMAWIDATGEIQGTYRKSHIPDGPGYEEKFYFRPGNDGFKVWDVPAWAGVPRVLPPGDVMLLRYTLGLPVEDRDLAPTSNAPVPTGDPLAAVRDNPASDAPRKRYAAVLEAQGDPRGELIALQLGRVERGETISERERTLVEQVGDRMLGALAVYLDSFELQRGFLAKARLAAGTHIPDELCSDPVWRTVEEVATIDPRVLVSPALSAARTARLDGKALARIVHHDELLSFERLLPFSGERGIALQFGNRRDVEELLAGTALQRVRALALDGRSLGIAATDLLASTFGRRLAHLDVWIEPAALDTWRAAFDACELPLLTLRFALDQIEPVLALERGDGPHRLTLELRATVSREIARDLGDPVRRAGRGLTHLRIVDTSLAPFAAQQPDLLDQLAPRFPAIDLRRGQSLALI